MSLRIVTFSDTHGRHPYIVLPEGDMLIFAGDYTAVNSGAEFENFIYWMASQPHPFKVFMPGNHDWFVQRNLKLIRGKLQQLGIACPSDRLQKIGGLKIFGMPLVPQYGNWAFMVPDGSLRMERACQKIPEGLDILVTHGPAKGVLDQTIRGNQAGSSSLLDAINRAKPCLHVFGHIHESHGLAEVNGVVHVNSSINDFKYRPINKPWVIDYPLTKLKPFEA